MNDLKFALRQVRNSPGFTAVVVITLALGIGANAAVFTLVRGVLIKPLVNRDEDRLIYIRQSAPGMVAHFLVGALKSLITIRSWWASGLEMTWIGIIVAVVTYGLGLAFGR
jgi:hypothetical protein